MENTAFRLEPPRIEAGVADVDIGDLNYRRFARALNASWN
jgi:hypothetical protein